MSLSTSPNFIISVSALLTKHLEIEIRNNREGKLSTYHTDKDFPSWVYGIFFNWITDPTQTPENILHLLDSYWDGFDGVPQSWQFQRLVGFSCLEALAERRPELLDGPWEKVALIIVKYSDKSFIGASGFKQAEETTLKWIVEFCTPKLCPNPCLRIELLRILRVVADFDYLNSLGESFRELVISTICEIHDKYSSLTVDQVPVFTAQDLMSIVGKSSLDIGSIMHIDHPEIKRITIIAALVKLTGMLALLAKERCQMDRTSFREFRNQLLDACLLFCGLIPTYCKGSEWPDFIKVVSNSSFLLKYVSDALDSITFASLSLNGDDYTSKVIKKERKSILDIIFAKYVGLLPMRHHLREIYGGITPAVEYQIRHFSNTFSHNMIANFNNDSEDNDSADNDSEDNDSEDNDSEDNDSEDNDSEDNDSEDNDSENNDSENNDSENNDSENNDSEDNDSEDNDSEDNDSEDNDSEDNDY